MASTKLIRVSTKRVPWVVLRVHFMSPPAIQEFKVDYRYARIVPATPGEVDVDDRPIIFTVVTYMRFKVRRLCTVVKYELLSPDRRVLRTKEPLAPRTLIRGDDLDVTWKLMVS